MSAPSHSFSFQVEDQEFRFEVTADPECFHIGAFPADKTLEPLCMAVIATWLYPQFLGAIQSRSGFGAQGTAAFGFNVGIAGLSACRTMIG